MRYTLWVALIGFTDAGAGRIMEAA
jgi:hypothetical protein